MSQRIIHYTVEALSTPSHGSVVCITLTVTITGTSLSCVVSQQMFLWQVKSKLLLKPSAVYLGSHRVMWLVYLIDQSNIKDIEQ